MAIPSGLRSSLPTPHANGQRQRAKHGRHRRHHDGPEPHQTGLINRFLWRESFLAFRLQREIHHHDRVLLYDADEQDDPDHRNEIEVVSVKQMASKRPQSRPKVSSKESLWDESRLS